MGRCFVILSFLLPLIWSHSALGQVTNIDLATADVAWDAARGRLLASTSGGRVWGNAVVAIAPETGNVDVLISTDGAPGNLAITADGRFLYVEIDQRSLIRRYRLSDLSLDLEIPLQTTPDLPWQVDRILPLSENPDSILVLRSGGGVRDLALFDGKVARPNTLWLAGGWMDEIHLRSSDRQLFLSHDRWLYWLKLDQSGVTVSQTIRAFEADVDSYFGEHFLVNGYCFVFDLDRGVPAGRMALPRGEHRCIPLLDASRDTFSALVKRTRDGMLRLVRYSADRFTEIADLELGTHDPIGVRYFGADGVVVQTASRLLLTRRTALAEKGKTPLPAPGSELNGTLRLALPTGGLVWDSTRRRLYASVSGQGGSFGNSIVSVDPWNGSVTDPVFIGSEPRKIVLSENDSRLFAALNGTPSVAQLNLETGRLESSFSVLDSTKPVSKRPDRDLAYYWYAKDIATVTADPKAVVVLRMDGVYLSYTPPGRSLLVYDQGVARPRMLTQNGLADSITRGDSPNTILSLNSSTTDLDLRRLTVDAGGITVEKKLNSIASGSVVYEDGRLFTGDGGVWTADTENLIGSFALHGIALPDTARNRVYYVRNLVTDGIAHAVLAGFDLDTFRPFAIGLVPDVGIGTPVRGAVLIEGEVIALHTDLELILFPLSSLEPYSIRVPAIEEVAPGLRRIKISANDIAVDAQRGRLIASTPSAFGGLGNSILTIDPESGNIEQAAFAGSEPSQIVTSPNGLSVYTWLRGESRIARIDLARGARDLIFAADYNGGNRRMPVYDIAAAPQEDAVAVSYFQGEIAIFDHGKPRPRVDRNDTHFSNVGSYQLAFDESGQKLYGYNQQTTKFDIKRTAVTPEGIVPLSTADKLTKNFATQIRVANGLIYSSQGDVIDPERSRRVGKFVHPAFGSPTVVYSSVIAPRVLPDRESNRVFFLVEQEGQNPKITMLMFDLQSYAFLGELDIPRYEGRSIELVKWGPDGLAFNTTGGEIYLVRISDIPVSARFLGSPPAQLPQTAGVRVLDLEVEDMVYDSARNLIFASVPNREGALGDTVTAIDPETLGVSFAIPVGANPRKLALGANRSLYVSTGFSNNNAGPDRITYTGEKIRRLDLESGEVGSPFGEGELVGGFYISTIADLLPLPWSPQSVAVVYGGARMGTVKIFDDKTPRPNGLTQMYSCSSIQPGFSEERLYCHNNYTSNFKFSRLLLTADGVSILDSSGPDLIGGGRTTILSADGLVYTTSGRVIDPENMIELGRVAANGPLAIDGSRLYWLHTTSNAKTVQIRAFDRATLQPAGSKTVNIESGEPASLISCGGGRLAFRSGQQIYIVDPF